MLVGCQPVEDDATENWGMLSNFTSVKDVVHHVGANVIGDDKDEIGTLMEAAVRAYSVKEYDMFGANLGKALHRIIVAPYPDEQLQLSSQHPKIKLVAPKWATIDFSWNFVDGLLNNGNGDMLMCVLGGLQPFADVLDVKDHFNATIHDRNITEFTEGIGSLGDLFAHLPPMLMGCQPVKGDATENWGMLSNFTSVKDVVHHVGANVIGDDGDEIGTLMEAAVRAYSATEYDMFGANLGKALHRIIVAPYPDEKLLV